ncbi:MAG: shikimate dehydrogenase (NADP(+)) [Candidatus Scalindua sp.]|nr:MAG: shikimate dehydrogenase (NADP(+)) [Candidatus Scalindua sp.]
METAQKYADIIELRLDFFSDKRDAEICLEKVSKKRPKPIIITNRPKREGGRYTDSEEERIRLLQRAIDLRFEYVDVEHDSMMHIIRRDYSKIIASYHNFQETPHGINQVYDKICQCKPDIVKIVTYAHDITDNIRIFELLKSAHLPIISFCMGENGHISRILTRKFGGFLTFASLSKGKESAPGQLTFQELTDTYHFKKSNKETKVYGIVGNPVSHSMSPAIHNSSFIEKGLNSIYVPLKVVDIGSFVREFRKINIEGFSITIPHKESIVPFLDDIDCTAEKIGAINTVVNSSGRFKGYNTDSLAALQGLENGMNHNEKALNTVAIIGAGGAARAIAYGLKDAGYHITIYNRTKERGIKLSHDIGCTYKGFEEISQVEANILINCTSIGMFPHIENSPVPKDKLKPGMVVFDAVYNPIKTRLLLDAEERGCCVVNGLTMFINQAAEQFRLWTGIEPPIELMRNVVLGKLSAQ